MTYRVVLNLLSISLLLCLLCLQGRAQDVASQAAAGVAKPTGFSNSEPLSPWHLIATGSVTMAKLMYAFTQADNSIGYVGYGHSGDGTRTLPIRTGARADQRLQANAENIADASTARYPQLTLNTAMQALLELMYSPAGTQIILRAGLLPLTAELQQQHLQGIIVLFPDASSSS